MAKVKQWHVDAAKGFLVGPNLSDSSVQKAAQIIADAEPAKEAPKGEWVKCAFGCGVDVHTNPSDPRARQSVQNHLCLNKVAAFKAQMDAISPSATGPTPCPKCQHIHSGQIICGHPVELRGPKAINAELEVKHGDNWKLSDAEKLIAQDGICQCPSATGPTPDALEPEEFIKAAFPDADLDKLEINARIVIKWLHEALAYAASTSGATPPNGGWSAYMGESLPCGHTNAQHEYYLSNALELRPCEVVKSGAMPGGEARPHSSVIYTDLRVQCGECGTPACWQYIPYSDELRFVRGTGCCDVAESAPITPTQPSLIEEIGALVRKHYDNLGCTEEECGCPGSQLRALHKSLVEEFHSVAVPISVEHPDNDVRCNLGKPNCTIHHEDKK